MDCRAGIISLILFVGTPVVFSCVTPEQGEACDAVFSANAMLRSCCSPMQEFVDIIQDCQKQAKTKKYTCKVSQCVTTKYGILTNGKIDEEKVKALIKDLNEKTPDSKPLNDMVLKNCLKKKYRQYGTVDRKCDVMKFQSCAFVAYLFGCQKFTKKTSYCKTLSANVATCKPALAAYLKKNNNKPC
ncbi:unnamed protein product [Chrysodeixis includens]|uniref:Uncharacterized protein n=1 Tax=Chrysodeixis includens TaxID=689277 RepID=A0A9N8KUD2_CHRIL|nr:unnamed protein product [Chrysodeixis includens]